MKKRIIILGGGYGGVLAAKKLEKKLKKNDDVEIMLIDRRPFHTMLTELHEVAANRVDEESIKIDFSKIFAKRRVKVVLDTIQGMDLNAKTLTGKDETYNFDYLIVASGSKPTCFGLEGAVKHAFHLWSYEEAVALREHTLRMFRSASCETDPALRREMLSFVVIGAGFTGVEMMGELAEWVPELCQKFDIPREEIKLTLCDVLPKIMPVLPEKVANKAKRRLEKMGVELILGTAVTDITETAVVLGDKTLPTRTAIWNAGVESSEIAYCVDAEKVGRGRIKVDEHLRIPGYDYAYVIGDNMFYIPEGEKDPVPQMVENCEHAAPVAANNILHSLGLSKELQSYHPKFHGMMVSIGGRYACAWVGFPGHMFSLASMFAMIAKHFINVIYFVQVAGWNKCWSYAMYEIFKVRQRRSIFGGHFANPAPVFFKVPLRMWVGFIWLAQASHKLFALLESGDKTRIFPISFPAAAGAANAVSAASGAAADAVSAASDAVSSASGAVSEAVSAASGAAAEAVSAASGAVSDVVTAASDAVTAASGVVADAAASLTGLPWLDGLIDWGSNWNAVATPIPAFMKPFVDWSLVTFIQPINEVFQVTMLVVLFLLAGSFVTGTLMPISSVVSAVVCVMIYLSGMAGREIVWIFLASIVLFGNSGMSFGVDYYLQPWIKKGLKKWSFTKKWYLYND